MSPRPSRLESPAQSASQHRLGPDRQLSVILPTNFNGMAPQWWKSVCTCSVPSCVQSHAPPATAMPVGLSLIHHFPRQGQSNLGLQLSGRLTLPPGPSLVSRSRPPSSFTSPYRPILAIPDIHRPSRRQKRKRSVHLRTPVHPMPWASE